MSEVGCYALDLYCDNDPGSNSFGHEHDPKKHDYGEFPHSYHGRTYGQCKREALAQGWKWAKDGRVLCPKCSGKKRARK